MIFGGNIRVGLSRFFKSGFKHCFVCLETNGGWIIYDPLSFGTEVDVLVGIPTAISAGIDHVERFYLSQGYVCVRVGITPLERKVLPLTLFTCTEAVKRILGIREWWIITPFQLFKYLRRQEHGEAHHQAQEA